MSRRVRRAAPAARPFGHDRPHRFGRFLDAADRRVDLLQIALSRGREPRATACPVEQRHVQKLRQAPHLVAYSRFGYAKGFRRIAKTVIAGSGVKGAQGRERRQAWSVWHEARMTAA